MSEKSLIVCGPKNDPPIPNETLGKHFIENLKKRGDEDPVEIDGVTKEILTVKDLLERSAKAVCLFKQLGLKKGDAISIISENTVGYNVPILAAWCMGAIINPLNPDYTIGELRHAFSISKPKLVLASTRTIENVIKLKDEFECLNDILLFGDKEGCLNGLTVQNFETLIKNTLAEECLIEPEQFDTAKTGCLIMLSSGTTGLPKGVLLTHKNLGCFYPIYNDSRCVGVKSGDITIGLLPFFHIFGFLVYTGNMIKSTKIIVLKKFIPDLFLNTIQEFKVNRLYIVPSIALFLTKSPIVEKYDLSTIEDIVSGGASVGKELQDEVIKRIGSASFRQVYGSTETTGVCTIVPLGSGREGSIGKLPPEMKAKVWNSNIKEAVGPMQTGELCFKGPTIINAYINVPNNSNIIDKDGFYHTGDIGYYDDEGFFYIVGRIKEVIKYKGFQVSPVELELLLLTHPSVKDCGVIGKPDERNGHAPFAFVVRQIGVDVSEEELKDYVAARVSKNKHLHGGVRFVDEIPKNSTGKILRAKLEKLLEEVC